MNYRKVFFEENIPINFEMIKTKTIHESWQKELQIGFIISGNINLQLNFEKKKISKENIFLINSNEIYSIIPDSEEVEIFMLYLNVDYLSLYLEEFKNAIFEGKSLENANSEEHIYIRKCFAILFNIFKNKESDYKSKLIRTTLELSEFLLKNCKSNSKTHKIDDLEKNKIIRISDYIDKNYSEPLSLKVLSQKFNLNPQYISRFFKENIGVGFQDYLNSLRVRKSINDLLHSNKNILDIALDNGFSEGKNYSRAFKREYGQTPIEFRKSINNITCELKKNSSLNENTDSLLKYLDSNTDKIKSNTKILDSIIEADCSTYKPLKSNINRIMAFGRAHEGLFADVQSQMEETQNEFHFEYVRFTGIFNDDMCVYTENEKGDVLYNWNYVDKLIDFLVKIKLKPFINLGYMPEQLASEKKYIFKWKGNISYPNSIEKWNNLVSNFILHLIDRYGLDEVESWYFEIWNNPDIKYFWAESRLKYFELFKNTLNSIKKISKNIKVGGPSGGSCYRKDYFSLWIRDLHNALSSNEYKIDFYSTHFYRYKYNIEKKFLGFIEKRENIKNVKIFCEEFHSQFKDKTELIITEWNPGKMYGNYTQDTCYMATNIVYDFINTLNLFSGMAYWTFSDIFEEYGISKNIFHGGFGLVTINGLKKASYNAFSLINKLGKNFVEKGEDWIITRDKNKIQILLCNYIEFDEKNFLDANKNVDFYNRYNDFEEEKIKNIKINLKNLEKGTYFIKRTRLSRNSGSIFDAWIKMGSPENFNNEIMKILKSKENMDFYIRKEEVIKDIEIEETLLGHSVTLFEIEKHL